jgi:hypothetical protein
VFKSRHVAPWSDNNEDFLEDLGYFSRFIYIINFVGRTSQAPVGGLRGGGAQRPDLQESNKDSCAERTGSHAGKTH